MTSDVTKEREPLDIDTRGTGSGSEQTVVTDGPRREYGEQRGVAGEYVERRAPAQTRDRVRWGPIAAGLLTAISSFLLLSLLAAAIGLQVATQQGGTDPGAAGSAGAIAAAVIGLLAFFIGGYVAAWTAALPNRRDGALNGFLVWALAILVILVLAGVGLGQVFGPTGGLFGAYRGGTTGAIDPNVIRTGALGAFLGMLLPALAATGGGWLGAREQVVTEERRAISH
jgi:cation transport ATPase